VRTGRPWYLGQELPLALGLGRNPATSFEEARRRPREQDTQLRAGAKWQP
jgi:hypothetical protein